MRNKVFTFILLISCIACNSIPKHATLIEEFPSTCMLQGDSIKNFDSELGIMAILNAGNYFICPSHRTDYHFAVYKKDSLKKICDIFPKGRGAGEFIAPAYFSQYQTESKETKIWVLEQALNQYLKINLSKTISSDSLHIEKTYDLSPFKSYSYRNMYVINDDLLFATRDDQDCKHVFLHLADKQQQEIDFSLPIPIRPYTHYISQTISAKHPSQPHFVSAYFNFPQIDFINEQGIYKTIFYKEIIQPRQSTLSQSEYEYFSCVCCDNNYVYALYNPYNATEDTYLETSEVLVFSWQGEAIQKYIIPFTTYICIDSENQRLYALNTQKETFNTTVYTLPFSLGWRQATRQDSRTTACWNGHCKPEEGGKPRGDGKGVGTFFKQTK